jgi:hypothetical protein
MQLTTFLSTAAMVATVSATTVRTAVDLNENCNLNKAYARVINRCPYDVHLWSVLKGTGCPTTGMVTLKTGESYAENYDQAVDGTTGVSIKISKTSVCKSNDIVQLEYFLQQGGKYEGNYLDVSYVDCEGMDCPTREEGYYLVAGNQTDTVATAGAGNTWCPVMSCSDPATCNKISYVLPDDEQTKTCNCDSSMDFYMCGSDAPSDDDESAAEPSSASSTKQVKSSTAEPSSPSSTEQVEYPTVAPTSTSTSSEEDAYTELINVAAAAVTNAPDANAVANANSGLTKTKVVYVTAYEYVNAKRHAHGHARRHQPFNA